MYRFLLIVLLLALISCDEQVEPDNLNIHPDNINLKDLQAGQRSYFLRYQGTCDFPVTASYTGDTLLLEVSSDEDGLYLSESFTPGSPLYKQNAAKVTYPVELTEEYLLLRDRMASALFFFYGNDTLRTDVGDRIPLSQSGCRILLDNEIFIGEEIGSITDFRIGAVRRNNLTAVSCVPMILELDAYLMYDEYLHISHMVTTTDNISGWVLSGL